MKDVQSLEEAGVGQMGRVEDHAQLLELLEQLHSLPRERPVVAGADRVAALAVMGQVHRPQPEVPPLDRLARLDDRVGPLHRQDVADRFVLVASHAALPVGIEVGTVRIIRRKPRRSSSS